MTDLGERYEEHHRERRDGGDFVFVPERIPLFQAAIGTGNCAERAMSCTIPRSFTKIDTALRGT